MLLYTEPAMVAPGDRIRQEAVEKVVQSSAFRQSETLRRLLRYLAEKALDGTAGQLKEYTIGVDALGKPTTYDPRQDSVVRIHVSRLRQRLNEYYRTEGRDDSVVLDLPKGHFKLDFEVRPATIEPIIDPANPERLEPVHEPAEKDPRQRWFPFLTAALVIATSWAVWSTSALLVAKRASIHASGYLSDEMKELWKPFLSPGRTVIISAAYPLFLGFQGAGFYRDPSVESLDQARSSPRIAAVRKALGNPAMLERHSYTTAGDASALFSMGRIFAERGLNVSMTKSAELTWQQLADNNVIMIGGPSFFATLLKGLPSELDYSLEEYGVRVLRPQSGQAAEMRDDYAAIGSGGANGPRDNGQIYALVTHVSGPVGRSDILSFCSNHNPGTLAAVEWFTNPDLVRVVASKIRGRNGKLPRFYQVVLRVRYHDGVPTDVAVVAHSEIQAFPNR